MEYLGLSTSSDVGAGDIGDCGHGISVGSCLPFGQFENWLIAVECPVGLH